jgi:hypothetical protein
MNVQIEMPCTITPYVVKVLLNIANFLEHQKGAVFNAQRAGS